MDLPGILSQAAVLLSFTLLVASCSPAADSVLDTFPTVAITADSGALSLYLTTPTLPPPSAVPTLPTSTPYPSATPIPFTPTPSHTPEITQTPTLDPRFQINGISFEDLAVIPPEVADHVREIAARGREMGRNPHNFSKIGDSAVLTESNLTRFDNGSTNLGPYEFLQPTVDHFAGSWARYGAGARVSLTTIGTFDPMWANPAYCPAGEHLLACEIRLNNPAILLIRLGTNEGSAERYGTYMAKIIQFAIEQGVVPVLGTKADRFEGNDSINETTRRLAADYRVPLWDFDVLANSLPNRGLTDDQAHLSVYRNNDYTDPETYTKGYPMSDLSALVVLDAVNRIMTTE